VKDFGGAHHGKQTECNFVDGLPFYVMSAYRIASSEKGLSSIPYVLAIQPDYPGIQPYARSAT
jgi:hypothetical protein